MKSSQLNDGKTIADMSRTLYATSQRLGLSHDTGKQIMEISRETGDHVWNTKIVVDEETITIRKETGTQGIHPIDTNEILTIVKRIHDIGNLTPGCENPNRIVTNHPSI